RPPARRPGLAGAAGRPAEPGRLTGPGRDSAACRGDADGTVFICEESRVEGGNSYSIRRHLGDPVLARVAGPPGERRQHDTAPAARSPVGRAWQLSRPRPGVSGGATGGAPPTRSAPGRPGGPPGPTRCG